MISISTFKWGSLLALRTNPRNSSIVMLATVAVTVATHNLAAGVATGVVLSGIFLAQKVARFFGISSTLDEARRVRTYTVSGQIFFATAEAFHNAFDFREEGLSELVVDVTASHFWDITGINALDRVVLKFRHHGVPVTIRGMNAASATLVDRLAMHNRPEASRLAAGH